jgi:DNA segregation ATPase FtsK/SpoIIIE, S-DNA-T family
MSFWSDLMARKRLIKAFRAGGIHLTVGSDNRIIYPKIHSIRTSDHSTEYVFTLPTGLDPKVMSKNLFAFWQVFGDSIKLDGEFKKYVLTVYDKEPAGDLKYDVKTIVGVIDGYRLGIVCGKDRIGDWVAFDLCKQPHILIAGETGSGKSTQLRSILTTLIMTKKPSELQLYLGDLKKSEFHIFKKVEHVQCVLSDKKAIGKMLKHIQKELEERSNLTETFEVSHVDDLPAEHRRPYIVVCIDEFVMLRKEEKVMEILTEIVAIGRTLGVFAILSMQRPEHKVLDTTIRANLTVSMGFKLRDKIEAKIVNTPNAEKIEQPGRFVMNSDKLYDLQAPLLELDDAKLLLNPYTVMKGPAKPVYESKPEEKPKQLTEEDVFG